MEKKRSLNVTVDVEKARYLVSCTDGMRAMLLSYNKAMEYMQRAKTLGYLASMELLVPIDISFNTEFGLSVGDAGKVVEVK